MKIVFAGSPEYAVPSLAALHKKYGICAVFTQPDRPVGRKGVLTPTPVKREALALGIPVYDFEKIRQNAQTVKNIGADIMITCAYGQILSEEILNCFKGGVWNLHASLLPEFRGASPIQSAILAGKTHTGVTVMRTEAALDSGDILLVKRCEVGELTCGELTKKLSMLSAEAAVECVECLLSGGEKLLVQDDSRATYCKKIQKEDAKLDFSKPAEEVKRAVKAFSPQPAAYCFLNGARLNIYNCEAASPSGRAGEVLSADKLGIVVACGKNSIRITLLQPAGGKIMPAADFVNGRKIKAGDVLE